MNVRPGELAVFVAGPNRDRFVEVISVGDGLPHMLSGLRRDWIVRSCGPLKTALFGTGVVRLFEKSGVATTDAWLRPIRDPGEDATDEMVALLGKPSSLPQPSKEHA